MLSKTSVVQLRAVRSNTVLIIKYIQPVLQGHIDTFTSNSKGEDDCNVSYQNFICDGGHHLTEQTMFLVDPCLNIVLELCVHTFHVNLLLIVDTIHCDALIS